MGFIRKITDSNLLNDIIDLPDDLKNRKVEIIVLPFENNENSQIKITNKSLKGVFSYYKDSKLINKEKNAWPSAVMEKYEDS